MMSPLKMDMVHNYSHLVAIEAMCLTAGTTFPTTALTAHFIGHGHMYPLL